MEGISADGAISIFFKGIHRPPLLRTIIAGYLIEESMGRGGQIAPPYTTRPHEVSEKGLIRPQMTLQIPWMGKLGKGKSASFLDFDRILNLA
jgi:hypothetical protein